MGLLSELFPTTGTFVIFIGYMALFINMGLLVTASKQDGDIRYNPAHVVLIVEALKLLSSVIIYLHEGHSMTDLRTAIVTNKKVGLLYFVPATLYLLYNILTFYNLNHYDPTTYFLLLQMRVVVTGLLFQIIFNQKLSSLQWLSILVLTGGCAIKQMDFEKGLAIEFNSSLLLITIQVFCSCFAGVYNEYLLKGRSGEVHTMVQNVFMYADSMIVNVAMQMMQHSQSNDNDPAAAAHTGTLNDLMHWSVIALIINNAAVGIVTSLFLKYLNSVLKTFASALELMFTAVLAWFFFGIPVTMQTFFAIALVSSAIYLYSLKPVKHTPTASSTVPVSKV